jgi:tetratricopeptide (TPR) repeat protein
LDNTTIPPDDQVSVFKKIPRLEFLKIYYSKRITAGITSDYGYLNLGISFFIDKNIEEAINKLTQALEIEKTNYYAYHALEAIQNSYPECNIYINHIQLTNPDYTKTIYDLYFSALNYYLAENLPKAIEDLEKASIMDPENPYNYYLLTEFCMETQNLPKAKIYSEKVLTFDKDEHAYDIAASTAVLNGNRERARQIVKILGDKNPDSPFYYVNMGAMENLDGNYQMAIEYFKKALQINPNLAEIYATLGNSYFNTGEHETALEKLHKAIEIDETCFTAYLTLGTYYFMIHEFSEAKEYAQKAIYYQPFNPTGYLLLGRILTEMNDLKEALECYEEAAKTGAPEDDVYAYRAYTCFNMGKLKVARENLHHALKINPENQFAREIQGYLKIASIFKFALFIITGILMIGLICLIIFFIK